MLIQEGLSRLKIIRKRMSTLLKDINEYSAWPDKIKCPLGIVGKNQEYSIAHAEKELKSKIQSYNDLKDEFIRLKIAIDKTNLATVIDVAGKKMTLHEAILYKREVKDMVASMLQSHDDSVRKAQMTVEQYNKNEAITEKANVLYLFPQSDIANLRSFIDEFAEEVDSKMQIANATTTLVFDDESESA